MSIPSTRIDCCLTLIGMAGSGKTTVGRALAQALGWAQVDTDRLVEAYYCASLQTFYDRLGREAFLEAEQRLVANLSVRQCVVSTGGSVIYGVDAVRKLKALGPVVFLDAGLEAVVERLEKLCGKEGRGLAIAPGQSVAELYAARRPLYLAAADLVASTDGQTVEEIVAVILEWLDTHHEDETR